MIWPDSGTTVEIGEGDVRDRLQELSGRCSESWLVSWVSFAPSVKRSGMVRYLIELLKPQRSHVLQKVRPIRCNSPHG